MKKYALLIGAALSTNAALAAEMATVDWSSVPSNTVTLFYPAQSSYQWLRSSEHKNAQRETVEGQACVTCHKGEEKALGDKLVQEGDLEPTPVEGKNGWVDLAVQAAYDDQNAYFRFQWKTHGDQPGIEYPYYRFDGKAWKVYGGPRLNLDVQDGDQPAIYEDRLTLMVDDGKVPLFATQGCWATCHDGERDMPGAVTKKQAAENPLLKALKKKDLRKFIPASRSDDMDWSTGKSQEEIAKLKAAGQYLDLFQWRAHRSNPVGMADDGYVLEYRLFDSGKKMFDSNMDGKTKQPKFMFDAAKFGAKAVTADQLWTKENFLIQGVNAVPFDPNAGWKEGDMLPRYATTSKVEGSAGDNLANGTWKDGVWTVVIARPLNLAHADDKAFKEGGVYNVGFAVHDDNITTRGHFVSFTRTLGFGAAADIEAVKLP